MFREIHGDNANTFTLWPLLLHLIIQTSVNLNLIAVCHGEAHWARVGDQLCTKHTAAAPVLSEVSDKTTAGDRLAWRSRPCLLLVCHGRTPSCLTRVPMWGRASADGSDGVWFWQRQEMKQQQFPGYISNLPFLLPDGKSTTWAECLASDRPLSSSSGPSQLICA